MIDVLFDLNANILHEKIKLAKLFYRSGFESIERERLSEWDWIWSTALPAHCAAVMQ
ncbi:MAG: hypothetical protein NTY50_02320 [Methylobacter sp.]|jgi:hypothetical protein|nr:hypothetical protein [Methylobacter sp.]